MSRSSAIAKSALFFALRRGKGGGSSEPGTGTDPYTWAVQNGVYTGNQNNFITDWKNSLDQKPFGEQMYAYIQSIGYLGSKSDMENKLLELLNSDNSKNESFLEYCNRLGFTNETQINTVMINLLNGTLTMKEFYKNLQTLGYKEDFNTMQDKIYELFTSVFATEEFVNNQITNVNNRIDTEVNNLNTTINQVNTDLQEHIKEDNDAHNKLQIEINNVNTNLTNTINTLEQKHDKDINDINNRITTEINNVNDSIKEVDDKLEQHIKDAENQFIVINNDLSNHEERITALENGEVGETTTPWTYFVQLTNTPNTPENKAKFDQNYIDMGNGDTVYAYAHGLYPNISKNDFNVIMLDLVMGKFYNQSIYQQLQDYGFEGTESQAAEWLLKLVNGELGDGIDPYNYMKQSFPEYTGTREEFNIQYGALMTLYLNGNANGGNANGEGMWDDKWGNYIPDSSDNPGGKCKTLYEMYKDIGYPGTEEELYTQLVTIAQTLFTDGGSSKDDNYPGNNDGFINFIPEPETPFQKDLYQLYQDIGLDKNKVTEKEFNTKAVDYMQNSLLPYVTDGGSSNDDNRIGENEGFINASVASDNNFQKSLYELYKDINNGNTNILTEQEFIDKFNSYINTSLLPDIVEGGSANGDLGENEGFINSDIEVPSISQKDLYQLFIDCGMNSDNISETEFNKKLVDLAENSKLPYNISGGSSEDNTSWGKDEGFINAEVESEGSCNSKCVPENISGGSADGTNRGQDNGFILGNIDDLITEDFFQTLKKAGYRYDINTLSEQILELTNVENYSVNVDGGGASTVNNEEIYDGPIPEARNAIIDYLISQGWEATEENIKTFDSRFLSFAEGSLLGELNDDSGANG